MRSPTLEVAQNSNYLYQLLEVLRCLPSHIIYIRKEESICQVYFFFFFKFHTENRKGDLPVIPFLGLRYVNSPFKNEQYT